MNNRPTSLLGSIWAHAQEEGDATAIERLASDEKSARTVSYGQLTRAVAAAAHELERVSVGAGARAKIGILAGNSPEWIIGDLALQLGGHTEIPVPLGFSYEQAQSMLQFADVVLVDAAGAAALARWRALGLTVTAPAHDIGALATAALSPSDVAAIWARLLSRRDAGGDFIAKVIHTSGTTSRPKGVRIRASALEIQTQALGALVGAEHASRYLSLVPLSLLIEQLCAVHLPLAHRGTVVLLPESVPPFTGGATRASDYLPYLVQAKPTLIMVPPAVVEAIARVLRDLVARGCTVAERAEALFGAPTPPMVTCGGAPISTELLEELFAAGLPVYEGYGLSENTAVACWNGPHQFRRGTVGRPLPHLEARISERGELLLRGPTIFAGYESTDPTSVEVSEDGWLHTGDLATIDDGYVTLHGRCKNLIINAASRNLSPEWVEGIYREHAAIKDVVVFGDKLEQLVALIVSEAEAACFTELRLALDETASRRLPDYAQIAHFVALGATDPLVAELFTVTGRPRREAIWQLLKSRMQTLAAAS
jgi:long-subunit acyl-CoA synthetase (AMP-forming)